MKIFADKLIANFCEKRVQHNSKFIYVLHINSSAIWRPCNTSSLNSETQPLPYPSQAKRHFVAHNFAQNKAIYKNDEF